MDLVIRPFGIGFTIPEAKWKPVYEKAKASAKAKYNKTKELTHKAARKTAEVALVMTHEVVTKAEETYVHVAPMVLEPAAKVLEQVANTTADLHDAMVAKSKKMTRQDHINWVLKDSSIVVQHLPAWAQEWVETGKPRHVWNESLHKPVVLRHKVD